ncbi:MAG TPA: purine-nucleoside phosphorylase [Gemmatimonadales bacterium]|nr:purine-nucleoside phosphorylase [Gemmatimonadales bacterium]
MSAVAVAAARDAVAARLGNRRPSIAIVLGSGLGGLAELIADPVRIPYAEIPGFHVPNVEGHKGELVVGLLGGKTVLAQSGRFHMYEGYSAEENVLPIRLFGALGIETLIVTNAAGGVRRTFAAGTLMLISDHLNLSGRNPLVGPHRPGDERFPDMTEAYDAGLRIVARSQAVTLGVRLEEGVYAGLLGPSYETPSEVRMLERLGADAVGMSTVAEVIAARAQGIQCLGFSLVTNPGAGISHLPLSHQDVMETAGTAGKELARLIEGIVGAMRAAPGVRGSSGQGFLSP